MTQYFLRCFVKFDSKLEQKGHFCCWVHWEKWETAAGIIFVLFVHFSQAVFHSTDVFGCKCAICGIVFERTGKTSTCQWWSLHSRSFRWFFGNPFKRRICISEIFRTLRFRIWVVGWWIWKKFLPLIINILWFVGTVLHHLWQGDAVPSLFKGFLFF